MVQSYSTDSPTYQNVQLQPQLHHILHYMMLHNSNSMPDSNSPPNILSSGNSLFIAVPIDGDFLNASSVESPHSPPPPQIHLNEAQVYSPNMEDPVTVDAHVDNTDSLDFETSPNVYVVQNTQSVSNTSDDDSYDATYDEILNGVAASASDNDIFSIPEHFIHHEHTYVALNNDTYVCDFHEAQLYSPSMDTEDDDDDYEYITIPYS